MDLNKIYNNYEYKLIKRELKKEFPWIIDIEVNEHLDEYQIPLDIYIDPYKLQETLDNRPLYSWVKRSIVYGEEFKSPYISTIVDIPYVVSQHEITNHVEKTINKINALPTNALPFNLKLNVDVSVYSWIIPENYIDTHEVPQEDIEKYGDNMDIDWGK